MIILPSYQCLSLLRRLFLIGLIVKILIGFLLLPFWVYFLPIFMLQVNVTTCEVFRCEAQFTTHFQTFWVPVFA